MNFRHLFFLGTIACSAAAFAVTPRAVSPLFNGKVVRTFAAEEGDKAAEPIPAASFPVSVIRESTDGSRYRVKTPSGESWVPKMDVKADKSGIDASSMCMTVLARAETGATRNANEGCRPK